MEHNVKPSAIRPRDCALMQYYTQYTHCSNLTTVNWSLCMCYMLW